MTAYTLIFAAIAMTPFSGLWTVLPLFSNLEVWLYVIGLGFLSTMLAFTFYTKGLTAVESSRASIIATVEPVVASLMGFLIFQEKLNVCQYFGIVMVILAVIILQESTKNSKIKTISSSESL